MKKDNRGFTLLEVLIATTVLAISLAGIYMLVRSNIDTANYTQRKVELLEAGNEFFYRLYLKDFITPTPFPLKLDEKSDISYTIKQRPLGIADVLEYILSFKKKDAELEYLFYK